MHPSTYYFCSNKKHGKAREDDAIASEIEAVIEKLPRSGHRTITNVLRGNRTIGKKRVNQIMKERGLMTAALLMAIERFGGTLKGVIHHTDSDSRYCSEE